MMNKKGNILDWFLIPAILLMVSICVFISYIIIDKVDMSDIFSENAQSQKMINYSKSTIRSFDTLMLWIIVGLSLFVVVSSAMVFNHPAFFYIGVFMLFIAVTLSGMISNVFWKFRTGDYMVETAALYPKITFLMEHLPIYILVLGMASAVAMYLAYNKQ